MKDFILSFILPRKMEEHRDMNLFIVVLLFLFSMIICAGTPAGRLNKLIKKNYLTDCYVFDGTYDAYAENVNLPTFSITNGEVSAYQLIGDQKVYEIPYRLKDGSTINLTLVYQFDVDDEHGIDKNVFSIDEYLSVNPFNEDHTLKQKDILAVFTKTGVYYIFNHGYDLRYISLPEGNLADFNYLNVSSWTETGNWSMYEHDLKTDDSGNKTLTEYYYHPKDQTELNNDPLGKNWSDIRTDAYIKEGLTSYTPKKMINNNMYELFTYNSTPNVGKYTYKTLEVLGEEYLDFSGNPLTKLSDLLVMDLNTSVRTYSYILSFFYVMVLPIIWVLIVWLIMHKNGELVRFREYYAIAGVAFLVPSIIIGIIGWFVPYQIIAKFAMIIHAGYYFVCISRINSMSKKVSTNGNGKKIIEATVETNPVVKTKPIQEMDDNSLQSNNSNSEHNRSKVSEIE